MLDLAHEHVELDVSLGLVNGSRGAPVLLASESPRLGIVGQILAEDDQREVAIVRSLSPKLRGVILEDFVLFELVDVCFKGDGAVSLDVVTRYLSLELRGTILEDYVPSDVVNMGSRGVMGVREVPLGVVTSLSKDQILLKSKEVVE